jgi:hypothetical protein
MAPTEDPMSIETVLRLRVSAREYAIQRPQSRTVFCNWLPLRPLLARNERHEFYVLNAQ